MRYDAERKARLRCEISCRVSLLCLSASIVTAPIAATHAGDARKTNAANRQAWMQLQKMDARINASRTRWLRTITRPAQSNNNVVRAEEQAAEQARQRGQSDDVIEKSRAEARRRANANARGTTQIAKFEIVHQFPRTRCVVQESLPVVTGTPSNPKQFSLVWDTFDGKNAVSVEGINKMTPDMGMISRTPKDILSRSLPSPGYRIFLAASPVTKYFGMADIAQNTANTVVLQKLMSSVPMRMRLTVDKSNWRPKVMEVFLSNGQLNARYSARAYKDFGKGISVPQQVLVTLFGRKGITSVVDFKLQNSLFNKAVNTAIIDRAIPAGAIIDDRRFGGTHYRSTGGKAADDNKVNALIRKQKAEKERNQASAGQSPTKTADATSLTPTLLGFLLLCGGVGLWLRSCRLN